MRILKARGETGELVRFGPELVLRGASERIGPIVMTALTTGWLFCPSFLR